MNTFVVWLLVVTSIGSTPFHTVASFRDEQECQAALMQMSKDVRLFGWCIKKTEHRE